jgi:cysteinyl-tRNA synthetase
MNSQKYFMSPILTLYNTATRTKQAFKPIDPRYVRMYVCGPTVYDYAHIGNARPVIVFDILFRVLRYFYGEEAVTYARNLTDVDDKINARAALENISIYELTEKTTAQFQKDVCALGCLSPTIEPRATQHIEEMATLIERLFARGIAYVAEDHVLFHVPAAKESTRAPRYGTLARRSLDDMMAGARVEVAPYKRDPMDFVLWKPTKNPQDPAWCSPCGIITKGRPGWHIECSAMSFKHLVQAFTGKITCEDSEQNIFDIHGGGIDLAFPHHENEQAQSCCAFDSPRMANIWMHNGFLQVEGQKMSKSLGNFITIRTLLDVYSGEVLRLNMLKTHYRQPIDWTTKNLLESQRELQDWAEGLAKYFQSLVPQSLASDAVQAPLPPDTELITALADDLNTSAAITHMRALYKAGAWAQLAANAQFMGVLRLDKIAMHHTSWSKEGISAATAEKLHPQIMAFRVASANTDQERAQNIAQTLADQGLTLPFKTAYATGEMHLIGQEKELSGVEITALITARNTARTLKNWAESDRIRTLFTENGIILTDNKDGTTTWVKA